MTVAVESVITSNFIVGEKKKKKFNATYSSPLSISGSGNNTQCLTSVLRSKSPRNMTPPAQIKRTALKRHVEDATSTKSIRGTGNEQRKGPKNENIRQTMKKVADA